MDHRCAAAVPTGRARHTTPASHRASGSSQRTLAAIATARQGQSIWRQPRAARLVLMDADRSGDPPWRPCACRYIRCRTAVMGTGKPNKPHVGNARGQTETGVNGVKTPASRAPLWPAHSAVRIWERKIQTPFVSGRRIAWGCGRDGCQSGSREAAVCHRQLLGRTEPVEAGPPSVRLDRIGSAKWCPVIGSNCLPGS